MRRCPRCGAQACVSAKYENVPFDQVAGAALAAKQAGKPAHAVSALAVWAGVEIINCFRDGWSCAACGWRS